MKRILTAISTLIMLNPGSHMNAQGLQKELQNKLATVKESVARNQASLRKYTWTEQTEILYKGEVKKTQQYVCRYGPDGKVQKTMLGQPAPEKHKRGLRGKIAKEKTDEMKDYMQRSVALIHNYVPPKPQEMQNSLRAGNVMAGGAGPAQMQLQLKNYLKPSDMMTFYFNSATKTLNCSKRQQLPGRSKRCCHARGNVRTAARWHQPRDHHDSEGPGQEHPGQYDECELPEARNLGDICKTDYPGSFNDSDGSVVKPSEAASRSVTI